MPKVTLLNTNFTAGELSPKLYGRVDVAKYQNGAKELRDVLPQVYGGVRRRPGSLFTREVKTSAKVTRLIPFVRTSTAAYQIELGDGYMRFYKDGAVILSGGSPYEIVSPFTEAQLFEVDYTQSADTMILFHEDVYPQRLLCAGDTSWSIGDVPFLTLPYEVPGSYPAARLSLGGDQDSPVGEYIVVTTGVLEGGATANIGLSWTFSFLFGSYATVEKTSHGYAVGDVIRVDGVVPEGYNGTVIVDTVPDANHFTYRLDDNPGGVSTTHGTSQAYSAGTSIFTSGDVGKTIKVNGGAVLIASYESADIVVGVIKQPLTSGESAPENAWSLHAKAWSDSRGYPRTGTFYEQRLVCGGSPTFPSAIWGSVTGAYFDFTQGVDDDDAFAFTLSSDVTTQIRYLTGGRSLIAFTGSGEFTIDGGQEKPITPTNAKVKPRTNHGCAAVRPVRVRDAELFVQRAGRKLRSFTYSLASDDWTAPDLALLAEHLTEGGIIDICWQQEPESILWMARDDGALISCTLDRDQDVVAWAMHDGFGQPDEDGTITALVESVSCIPTETGDEVWLVVRRTVNGSTKRYVERLSDETALDCAVVSTGAASDTWAVEHLEAAEVAAVAGGAYSGVYEVESGSVTLPAAATSVNIGLSFTPSVTLLPPEIQTGMGSAIGNAQRTSELTLRVHETAGCSVNGKPQVFRRIGEAAADAAPQSFSGLHRVEQLGWARGESEVVIEGQPGLPFHLLSVARKFTVNEG